MKPPGAVGASLKFDTPTASSSEIIQAISTAGWSRQSLLKWDQFCALAIPGTLMVSMETFCWEIGTFVAGSRGPNELGAQSVLFQTETWFFMVTRESQVS